MQLPNANQDNFEERIISAAISLFGIRGYYGVSTRDIATLAAVNEVTIYRHFARKRNLYMAAISAEFAQVQLSSEGLREIADSSDFKQALHHTFRLVEATLLKRPRMLQLLLYGLLEDSAEFDDLFRKHFEEPIQVLAGQIEPWIPKSEKSIESAQALVLGAAAVAICSQTIARLFPTQAIGVASVEAFANHFPLQS